MEKPPFHLSAVHTCLCPRILEIISVESRASAPSEPTVCRGSWEHRRVDEVPGIRLSCPLATSLDVTAAELVAAFEAEVADRRLGI
jgi:hypothetical protein